MHRNRRNISDGLHIPDLTEQLFFRETRFGFSARKVSRSNSFVVNCFSAPFTHTRRAVLSILMPRISTTSFSFLPFPTRRSYRADALSRAQPAHSEKMASSYNHPHQDRVRGFVDIILLCRNHDNRNIFLLTHLTADLKAIHLRQHQSRSTDQNPL